MSYAIQATLHGRSDRVAWLFHDVNGLLHAAVCAAVAEMTRPKSGRAGMPSV
jgi:hypothetical protein